MSATARERTKGKWKRLLQRKLVDAPAARLQDVVADIVLNVGRKWSYRFQVWILLRTVMTESGILEAKWWKKLETFLNQRMLWEDPTQAPLVSPSCLRVLLNETDPRFAVANSLLLPSGMRFADACRLRACDVAWLDDQSVSIRVRQTKTIRSRRHQRWLVLRIPRPLSVALHRRLSVLAFNPMREVITVGYREYLAYLKRKLGANVTTYSIRRTVINIMARKVKKLEDLQLVTMHRTANQLRWYLDAPLQDESRVQKKLSSWHCM
jgi:integrase